MSAMRLRVLGRPGKQYSQSIDHMLPKQGANKTNTNKHAAMKGRDLIRYHRQPRNAEPWRNSLFQVGAHQLVNQ